MTTIKFRLQRVLEFRRTQFQIADSDCQRAQAKLHAIQAQQATLAAQKSQTRRLFSGLAEVSGQDLAPLPDWYKWIETASDNLTRSERVVAQELEKCRGAVVEAQRRVRLLEKLHDNRKAQWQSDLDRETEEQAADVFRWAGFTRHG